MPKPILLTRLVPVLASLLCRYNAGNSTADRSRLLRLRSVVRAGEVHVDGNGYFGEDLDVAFRLLDAPDYKDYRRLTDEPLGVVVSDSIYWSIVRHGYEGLDARAFLRLVSVTVAGRDTRGWVYAPPAV